MKGVLLLQRLQYHAHSRGKTPYTDRITGFTKAEIIELCVRIGVRKPAPKKRKWLLKPGSRSSQVCWRWCRCDVVRSAALEQFRAA